MHKTVSVSGDKISAHQATIIVINNMLGTGILTMPRAMAEVMKTPDLWISTLLSSIIIFTAGLIIVKLCQRYPGKTIFQFTKEITGSWIAFGLVLIMITYYIIISAFELRIMAEVTIFYLLEGTPFWSVIIVFMWVSCYLIIGGINSISYLSMILLPITGFIFVVIVALSLRIFDIENLRPVLGSGITPVLKGIKPSLLSFTGFEVMLVAMAYMKTPKDGTSAVMKGIAVPLVIYTILNLLVIGSLTVEGTIVRSWPTLDVLRNFEFEGFLFERFETLLLIIWVMQIFATFSISYYTASLGLSQLFKKKLVPILIGLLPVIYLLTMLPKDIIQTLKVGDMLGNQSLLLFCLVPLLLLMVSGFRMRKSKKARLK
ncbi:spore germination protein [Neobacillus mesonae]|nr:spore germination protein [Neobacillus mesonae]